MDRIATYRIFLLFESKIKTNILLSKQVENLLFLSVPMPKLFLVLHYIELLGLDVLSARGVVVSFVRAVVSFKRALVSFIRAVVSLMRPVVSLLRAVVSFDRAVVSFVTLSQLRHGLCPLLTLTHLQLNSVLL